MAKSNTKNFINKNLTWNESISIKNRIVQVIFSRTSKMLLWSNLQENGPLSFRRCLSGKLKGEKNEVDCRGGRCLNVVTLLVLPLPLFIVWTRDVNNTINWMELLENYWLFQKNFILVVFNLDVLTEVCMYIYV